MPQTTVKLITVTNPPPLPSTGPDVNKGEPMQAAELDQNFINLRAALPVWSTEDPVDGVGMEGQLWIKYVE